MSGRSRKAGFTILEVLIGMAIMSVLLGAVLLTQRATQGLQLTTVTSGMLEQKAQRAVESMASELRWADTSTFLITQENGSDRLDLQTPTGFVADETVWSTAITYRIDPSTVDANENGVLDEGRLVRIQDGRTRTLCDFVVAGGFSTTVNDDNIQIQVSLAKRNSTSDALLTADAQTSISVRN